jgi:hypothetical protein
MKPNTAVGKLDTSGIQWTFEAWGYHGIAMHREYQMQAYSGTIKSGILNNLASLKQNHFYL